MKVKDIFKVPSTTGDLGVEIEVEGAKLPEAAEGWWSTKDGSLRGESMEYVLSQPQTYEETVAALGRLKEAFENRRSKFFESYRAGVHVHVNVQELTGVELASLITTYYMLEGALVRSCRKDRWGNHFCLRTSDAAMGPIMVRSFFKNRMPRGFNTDELRYSALNLTSLPKYGSVEFRAMESTYNFDKVALFAKRHLDLRNYAVGKTPVQIVEDATRWGLRAWGSEVVKDTEGLFDYEDAINDFDNGLEIAEDFAFCHNWGKKSLDIFSKEDNLW